MSSLAVVYCKHFGAHSVPALQREAAWAKERPMGDIWQSVPQNRRVHLHILDQTSSRE